MEILNLTWLFLLTISFPSQIVLKNNRVLDCSQTTQIQCLIVITTYVRCLFDMNRANDQCRHVSSVTRSHRFASKATHTVTGFLRVIYAILNASVILERNEKCLERNEKRLERNETRLARNETRGGNLHLSGTVHTLFDK